MKLFECQACEQLVYFENHFCDRCDRPLGFLPKQNTISAVERSDEGEGIWTALADPEQRYHFCANAAHEACNWLAPTDDTEKFCPACRLNRTVPDLTQPENRDLWRKLESAKHRLIYSLLRFRLPLSSKTDDPETGLAFDFLADPIDQTAPRVMTGHADGVITLNIAEADPVEREHRRRSMREPLRTLLGHFRHEIGHYYWDRLVANTGWLEPFRERFGDERADYGAALQRYYDEGPSDHWRENFLSAYASAHPWEDWAESWAHYMHMIDTLETAYSFGLRVRPRAGGDDSLAASANFDPYRRTDFEDLIETWLPVTFAINSLNRSMGQPDLYPFVLSPTALAKIRFVHDVIRNQDRD